MTQRKTEQTEQAVLTLLAEIERLWDPSCDDHNDYQRACRVLRLAQAVRAAHADDEVASWSKVIHSDISGGSITITSTRPNWKTGEPGEFRVDTIFGKAQP